MTKTRRTEIARLQGRVEMIDYCMNTFCRRELTEEARQHLKNVRYKLKLKIDAYDTGSVSPDNADGSD